MESPFLSVSGSTANAMPPAHQLSNKETKRKRWHKEIQQDIEDRQGTHVSVNLLCFKAMKFV